MSQQALEQFVTQIADSEELRTQIEGQLDSDGEISMDELIGLGAAYGIGGCGGRAALRAGFSTSARPGPY